MEFQTHTRSPKAFDDCICLMIGPVDAHPRLLQLTERQSRAVRDALGLVILDDEGRTVGYLDDSELASIGRGDGAPTLSYQEAGRVTKRGSSWVRQKVAGHEAKAVPPQRVDLASLASMALANALAKASGDAAEKVA